MEPVDLYDATTFEREIPHDYFTWLRENEPIHWQTPRQVRANNNAVMQVEQHGYWAITRHREVTEVSLDQKRFSSERGTVILTDIDIDIEVNGPIRRLRSTGVNSVKSMPVRFAPKP